MQKQKDSRGVDRRGFFRSLGAAGAAGTAIVAGAAAPAEAAENDAARKKTRYKETDHVKSFYRTNRY